MSGLISFIFPTLFCRDLRPNMNHMCHKSSSKKQGSSFTIKHSNVADKKCCPINRTATVSSRSICCGQAHGHCKMKRLKTHRQRNQLRASAKKASGSNHHHCQHPRSTDITHLQMCCQSSCSCPSRSGVSLPHVVPAAQEPSIITGNRLTGHQCLFKGEVRSVDIDRLLGRHRDMKENLQETPITKSVYSHPPLVPYICSPSCTNQCSKAKKSRQHAGKNTASEKSSDVYKEEEGKQVFESDITPAQRPRQHLDPLSQRDEYQKREARVSPSPSSLSTAMFRSRRDQSDINKRTTVCSLKGTPENPGSAISNTQAHSLCSEPVTPSRPQQSEVFCHGQREPGRASQSFRKVAASFFHGLRFPYLKQRNLVAEGREVLLKALDKSHGPYLQENLLRLQQDFGFSSDPTNEVQDPEMSGTDTDDFFLAGRKL